MKGGKTLLCGGDANVYIWDTHINYCICNVNSSYYKWTKI